MFSKHRLSGFYRYQSQIYSRVSSSGFSLPFGHSVPQKEAKDVMIITFFPLHTTISPAALLLLYYLPRQRPASGAARERGSSLVVFPLSPPSRFSLSALLPLFPLQLDLLGLLFPRSGTGFPDHNNDDCHFTTTIVAIDDDCHYR